MDNPFHWIVDYFATEPVRVSAILRLPLIGVLLPISVAFQDRPALTAIFGT